MLARGLVIATALVVALAGLAAACGGDGEGSEEDRAEVEQTIRDLAAYGAEDIDAFLEQVTDNVLDDFFGFSREECRQNAADCVGEPSEVTAIKDLKVSGDEAEAELTFTGEEEGESFDEKFRVLLIKEEGVWKLDGFAGANEEIPEGVDVVDLELNEFSFEFDTQKTRGGGFAFSIKNSGDQAHEVVLVKVPEDLDIEAALESEDQPEGVEDIASNGPFPPGDEGTLVFDEPLEPGRYVLLCFLPDSEDPEGTQHANKGMWAEFTVE